MSEWEVFKRPPKGATSKPTVTIGWGGQLILTRASWELLGAPVAVELLYDSELSVIGFRPAEESNPNAYIARNNRQVAGKAFLDWFGITIRQARFRAVLVEGVLCVDLKSEPIPYKRDRKKRGEPHDG